MEEFDLDQAFENRTVLITGCTGFVGRNVLAALIKLNVFRKGLLEIVCVSRNSGLLLSHIPKSENIKLLDWDISLPLNCSLPNLDFVFHLAGETGRSDIVTEGKNISATNVLGTFNVLEATRRSTNPKILLASSGAVYDNELNGQNLFTESSPIAEEADGQAESYQQSKIRAESILLDAMANGSVEVVIARLFTFVGPYMASIANYAIASFLRDCLLDRVVRITGDGTSVRSYQYSEDLGKWLIHMLLFAENGSIYNVGSDKAISMKDLAETVCTVCKNANGFETLFSSQAKSTFYVPDTNKAKTELGLTNEVGLLEAIRTTYENLKSRTDG